MGEVRTKVEQSIRHRITELGPGARLPSERELSAELEAGRTTVRLVLALLSAEGLIRAEHGRGYFVSDEKR